LKHDSPHTKTRRIGSRFEPTYKELKHWTQKFGWQRLWSFEPTYKELKLLSFWSMASKLFKSFEPTYKELKQVEIWDVDRLKPCFEPTYKELKPE